MNNIKKSDLIRIIESVVRECIKERRAQLNEAGLTSEKADGQISPLEDIIRAVIKSGIKDKKEIVKKAHELYKKQMNPKGADDEAVTSMVDDLAEASYKVTSPNETDTAKEDKARAIQTEPKVNETAFKKQGPSAKTFKDSPQFPEAVNDPENA